MRLRAVPIISLALMLTACGFGEELNPEPDTSHRDDGRMDAATADDADMASIDGWRWNVPEGFPLPRVPDDNPMSAAKVELGRRLFYDKRLSENETQSCASCHKQELAFTDGLAVSIGSTGLSTPRGSMALGNTAYNATMTWANPLLRTLEKQMLTPLFGDDPPELGLLDQETMLERLRADADYVLRFDGVFGPPMADEQLINLDRTTKAIAAFERSLITTDSRYDRYRYGGDNDALTAQEKRGMDLFFSERLECFHCHGSFNFADSTTHEGTVFEEISFHNNGLYNIGGSGAYPPGNQGIFEFSGVVEDTGRFRAPTLRNIALTAPYMHDGSLETLSDVVDHYARGGTLIEDGPYAGDGKFSPFKSSLITGFIITDAEKADLLAFFETLTDETFITNPAYSDPFEETP